MSMFISVASAVIFLAACFQFKRRSKMKREMQLIKNISQEKLLELDHSLSDVTEKMGKVRNLKTYCLKRVEEDLRKIIRKGSEIHLRIPSRFFVSHELKSLESELANIDECLDSLCAIWMYLEECITMHSEIERICNEIEEELSMLVSLIDQYSYIIPNGLMDNYFSLVSKYDSFLLPRDPVHRRNSLKEICIALGTLKWNVLKACRNRLSSPAVLNPLVLKRK